ncbi:MAG: LacI family DNA-binding transcriptional regulator [Chitinophagales bacterium]
MSTIYEVAKLANVSTATVSRVLNRSGYASAGVRQRVEEAAAQLDFVPSLAARSLVNKRTHALALVIPDIANPFFPALARGAEDAASATRHSLILCNTDGKRSREQEYVALLREKRVDGVIQAGTALSRKQLQALQNSLPLVAVDRAVGQQAVDAVVCDNRLGARLAIEHLLALGHRRIGVVAGPKGISTAEARLEGALAGLSEAGAPLTPDRIAYGDFSMEGGYLATKQLLPRLTAKREKRQFALFAANDQMAAGALWALREAGIEVPAQASVVGYDDIPLARFLYPQLTTVAQPAYELGRTAVDLLVSRLAEPERPYKTVVLAPALAVRASTARVSESDGEGGA